MVKPSLTEEQLNWSVFNGKNNAGVKNGGIKENYKPEQKPISSTIYKQQTNSQQINNEVRLKF